MSSSRRKDLARHCAGVGIPLPHIPYGVQPVTVDDHVVIDERHDIAPGGPQRPVAGEVQARARLDDVAGAAGLGDGARAPVRRRVVHDDDLVRSPGGDLRTDDRQDRSSSGRCTVHTATVIDGAEATVAAGCVVGHDWVGVEQRLDGCRAPGGCRAPNDGGRSPRRGRDGAKSVRHPRQPRQRQLREAAPSARPRRGRTTCQRQYCRRSGRDGNHDRERLRRGAGRVRCPSGRSRYRPGRARDGAQMGREPLDRGSQGARPVASCGRSGSSSGSSPAGTSGSDTSKPSSVCSGRSCSHSPAPPSSRSCSSAWPTSPSGTASYQSFVFCGLAVWTYFSSALAAATASLVSNASLITKVYFPRLAAPLSSLLPGPHRPRRGPGDPAGRSDRRRQRPRYRRAHPAAVDRSRCWSPRSGPGCYWPR